MEVSRGGGDGAIGGEGWVETISVGSHLWILFPTFTRKVIFLNYRNLFPREYFPKLLTYQHIRYVILWKIKTCYILFSGMDESSREFTKYTDLQT